MLFVAAMGWLWSIGWAILAELDSLSDLLSEKFSDSILILGTLADIVLSLGRSTGIISSIERVFVPASFLE